MPRRTGRKLVGGVVVLCGTTCGAVALAAPAGAPQVGTVRVEVRAEATTDAVVVDLEGLDAAVDAARLAEPTTTASAPAAAPSSTTTSTAPAPVTASSARTRTAAPTTAPPATTTTTAAPAAPPRSAAEEAIARWFPEVYEQAVRVARCESNMDPAAVSSGGGNHGLFQINDVHQAEFEAVTGRSWSDVYDAYVNARFARHLYDESGWSPWACSP